MTAETSAPESGPAPARPTALLIGAAIAAVEGAALTVGGLYMIVAGFLGDPARLGFVEFGGAILLALGLFTLFAVRALLGGRKWGRTPAVLVDTMALAFAYFMWPNGGLVRIAAVAVGVLGLAGIVALLNPKVTATLYG